MMHKTISWTVVGVAIFAAACSGSSQSVSPVLPGLSNPAFRGTADSNVTANVVVTIPNNAPAAKSASISVNGGTPVVANISSGSPGCGGSNPRVCTISVSAPAASDDFTVKTFTASNGTGSVVASGNIFQTITTTAKTVRVTLAGIPRSITLALKTTTPRECDPATAIPLYAMVMDSSKNVIIGTYGESVKLADSDTSGTTHLTLSSISNSSTSVKLAYYGHLLQTATISASASGVTSVMNAVLKPTEMIYVSNYYTSTITVYPANSKGNVVPARTIAGGHTGISNPQGVALDRSCNLDVLNQTSSILVFSAGANGDVTPLRTITGSNTLLGTNVEGIAVDAAGNIYAANTSGGQVLEFDEGAIGNVAPIANISGSKTNIHTPEGVAVGPNGKIYETESNVVKVFAAGAKGNVAPIATITNKSRPFGDPRGIAIDPTGKIFVADRSLNDVAVFAANANGNSTPIALISGSNTLLGEPAGLSLSYAGGIGVCNFNGSFAVFSTGSNGNVAPKAVVQGNNTGLNGPTGSAI